MSGHSQIVLTPIELSSSIKPTSRIGLSVVDRGPGRRSKLARLHRILKYVVSQVGNRAIMTVGLGDQNGWPESGKFD